MKNITLLSKVPHGSYFRFVDRNNEPYMGSKNSVYRRTDCGFINSEWRHVPDGPYTDYDVVVLPSGSEYKPPNCHECEHHAQRFNGGQGAITCDALSNRIVQYGWKSVGRPAECPLDSQKF